MVERLTDDELHALEHQRLWSEDEQRLLLTEVRERRAEEDCLGQLAAEVGLPRHDHAGIARATKARDGAGGRERGHLARIAELEAALRECVEENDPHGWAELFALGIQAEAFSATEKGDTAAMEKADAITDRARAALAKGET